LFNFKSESAPRASNAEVEAFLTGYSIEVMPRTADAVFYQLYFQEPGVAEFVKLALENAFYPRAEAMVLRG
jgi:hypothetical protein